MRFFDRMNKMNRINTISWQIRCVIHFSNHLAQQHPVNSVHPVEEFHASLHRAPKRQRPHPAKSLVRVRRYTARAERPASIKRGRPAAKRIEREGVLGPKSCVLNRVTASAGAQ